jgi:multidrug efflux system membrane fusion protein
MGRTRILFAIALAALVGGIYLVRVHAAPEKTTATTSQDQKRSNRPGGGIGGGPGIAVVTAPAVAKDVADTRQAVGWVEPVASVAVRPRIDGMVVDEKVTDGSTVKAGDVLLQLDDSAIRAAIAKDQAAILKDQANLDEANVELKRARELLAKAVDTQEQVDQQQAAAKVLEATVAMDKAQLQADQVQLGYATITAPIAGRTGVVNVTNGALVHASDQTPLVTITQMAPLRVSFDVPERDLDRYRAALAGSGAVDVTLTDTAGKQLATGRLAFIDSSVDTSSGAIVMKAEFPNADGALWPGQYVQVQVRLGETPGATVVPLVAVQQNDQGPYVFLVKPDHMVALQPVTVASTGDEGAVVTSGVKPGDRVVVEGQLRLKDGSAVREGQPGAAGGSAGS